MIRFRYNQSIAPPAPFVYITIIDPLTSVRCENVPAQIDTAADRTVLPTSIVDDLELCAVGEMEVGGLGGTVRSLSLYGVRIGIHDLPPSLFKVLACKGEPWVLLGRDVLNHYRIALDGPGLALEL